MGSRIGWLLRGDALCAFERARDVARLQPAECLADSRSAGHGQVSGFAGATARRRAESRYRRQHEKPTSIIANMASASQRGWSQTRGEITPAVSTFTMPEMKPC